MMRNVTCIIILSIVLSSFFLQPVYALEGAGEESLEPAHAIPFKRPPIDEAGSGYRVVLMTTLAAGVAVGSAFLIKKYLQQRGLMHPAKGNRITIIDAKRVSQKLTIFLIAVDKQSYIVAQSGDQTTITRHHASGME